MEKIQFPEWIVYKPFQKHRGKLYPTGTKCWLIDGNIFVQEDKEFLCRQHSQHARDTCLCSNTDGQGLKRGRLIDDIKMLIWDVERARYRMPRVEALFKDPIAIKYQTPNCDSWIFNDLFYAAHMFDLQYIYELVRNTPPDYNLE